MINRRNGVPWIAAMAVAALVASVAGCSDGGDGPAGATSPPAATAGTGTSTAPAPAGTTGGTGDGTTGGTSSLPPAHTSPAPPPDSRGRVLRVSEWTSQPLRVEHNPAVTPMLVAVRTGHHEEEGAAYDRVTFEFVGELPGYDLRYVPEVFTPGEGAPFSLRGQAFMEVVFYPAAAHDENGASTLRTPSGGGGIVSLHEYKMAGDFEGYVHYGLGIDDVVGYRVTELANPSRIAVDVFA